MSRTPGLVIPSAYDSEEEMKADLKRRAKASGYTPFEPDEFSHSICVDDFLAHYGVKGMKWGIRRERGPDGRVSDRIFSRKKLTKKETKARNGRKRLVENRRLLSDEEVKRAVERLQNEKKLKDLVEQDLSPAKSVVKKVVSESGQRALGTVVAGIGVYTVRAALEKKFDPKEASKHLKPKK